MMATPVGRQLCHLEVYSPVHGRRVGSKNGRKPAVGTDHLQGPENRLMDYPGSVLQAVMVVAAGFATARWFAV